MGKTNVATGESTKPEVKGHDKASRLERGKERSRGMFLCLLSPAKALSSDWVIVADENEAIENDGDIMAWMEENEFVGTVYPARFSRSTSDKDGFSRKSATREPQQVFKTIMQ